MSDDTKKVTVPVKIEKPLPKMAKETSAKEKTKVTLGDLLASKGQTLKVK